MKVDNALLGQIVIALGGIVSTIFTAQRIMKGLKEERDKENEKILDRALSELEKEKTLLEIKIQACENENERLKEMMEKEIEFVRSTYNTEIKNLGEKIESLKEEVKSQNTQIIGLLSKLIS
jgi:predicted nuclease with TOPRIM domain